jgi:lipopolysaccharide heptosyltransferase II
MEISNPRILILRLSSIGDIILTSAFLRQVKDRYKDAEIDFVVKEQYLDLVKNNPNLDNIFTLHKTGTVNALNNLRKTIEKNQYDFIFDLHNNLRTRGLLKNFKENKISRIKKNKIKRAILVEFKINLFKQIISIPQRYLKTGQKFDIKDDNKGLELFFDEKTEQSVEKKVLGKLNNGAFIAVGPGASFFTKQWPTNYFQEWIEIFLKERKEKILLLGGQDAEDKFSKLDINDRVINLIGKTTLLESAYIIKKAKALLSNDSGLMHMATAVQTPVAAIFGSTVEELGFAPFRSKNLIIQNESLWCRPCSHIGKNKCPLAHFKCMKEIAPVEVYNKFMVLLNN